MNKLILVFLLMFGLVFPGFADAKGFSGHSSFSSSHTIGATTYHSGYKAPSSNVTRTPSYSNHNSYNNYNKPSGSRSFWSHAAAFGAGTFLGSMFHPFGGHYYGPLGAPRSYGFSFLGLLFDVLIIVLIISGIKRLFGRRRY